MRGLATYMSMMNKQICVYTFIYRTILCGVPSFCNCSVCVVIVGMPPPHTRTHTSCLRFCLLMTTTTTTSTIHIYWISDMASCIQIEATAHFGNTNAHRQCEYSWRTIFEYAIIFRKGETKCEENSVNRSPIHVRLLWNAMCVVPKSTLPSVRHVSRYDARERMYDHTAPPPWHIASGGRKCRFYEAGSPNALRSRVCASICLCTAVGSPLYIKYCMITYFTQMLICQKMRNSRNFLRSAQTPTERMPTR